MAGCKIQWNLNKDTTIYMNPLITNDITTTNQNTTKQCAYFWINIVRMMCTRILKDHDPLITWKYNDWTCIQKYTLYLWLIWKLPQTTTQAYPGGYRAVIGMWYMPSLGTGGVSNIVGWFKHRLRDFLTVLNYCTSNQLQAYLTLTILLVFKGHRKFPYTANACLKHCASANRLWTSLWFACQCFAR